jgi:hypothetical protein
MLSVHPKTLKLYDRSPKRWPYSLTYDYMMVSAMQARNEAAHFLRFYRSLPKEQQTDKLAKRVKSILRQSREACHWYVRERDRILSYDKPDAKYW